MNLSTPPLYRLLILIWLLLGKETFAQTKLIKSSDQWHYYNMQASPETNWKLPNGKNTNWKVGKTPIGYGDSSINTLIKTPNKKNITTYFSKSFSSPNPTKFMLYEIKVKKDDGIVLYLNGKEIFRNNMPTGTINHSTKASAVIISEAIKNTPHSLFITPENFVSGVNYLSASIHQGVQDSEDLLFDLELIGHNSPDILPILVQKNTAHDKNLQLKLDNLLLKQKLEKTKIKHNLIEQSTNNSHHYFIFITLVLVSFCIVLLYKISIYQKKLKKSYKNKHQLINQTQSKDAEIMDISLNTINNKLLLKEVKKRIEKSLKKHKISEIKTELINTINTLEKNINTTENWLSLKNHFNALNSGYLDKLNSRYPALTEIELRHCIFIKLHLQTKEIANILHVDPRSVQTARYRIKKKMNLGERIDLKEYLLSIS